MARNIFRVEAWIVDGNGTFNILSGYPKNFDSKSYNDDVARLMRQHNNANVISFGQAFMSLEDVLRRVDIFLKTEFEGGRHQTRVDLISDLEK